MTTQGTKSRKMLVKLMDKQGNIYSKIFPIELPANFDQQDFQIDSIKIAKKFVRDYPNSLAKLVCNLITAQVDDLEKIKILADSTLETKLKTRFLSDYNKVTANRITTVKNLHPKVKAYRAEKNLDEIPIERFLRDFLPKDDDGKKWTPFQYLTIDVDENGAESSRLQSVEIREKSSEIAVAVSAVEPEAVEPEASE